MSLNDLPQRKPDTIKLGTVRGNDNLRLYGKSAPRRRLIPPFHDHSLSDAEERKLLFEERFGSAINVFGTPIAASNHKAFDDAVEQRLAAPIWQRAYRLTGDIAVSGNRGFVYQNGRLFRPSAAEKLPPYNHFLKRLNIRRKAKQAGRLELDRVLLVRHVFGHIYFHTYHDLMSKIVWADELGLDHSIPIVVSGKWARGHYGKHFVCTRLTSGREVIFQEWEQALHCNELYWLRPPQFHREHLDAVADSFDEVEPRDPPGPRLVLVREKKTHDDRFCEGIDVLRDHLVDLGYSAIDPGNYTIPEQKWIFARAEHIVGENGSAFTNAIFRKNKALRIDSIIGCGSATTTFQALSSVYGFDIRSHVVSSSKDGQITRVYLDRETASRIVDGL